MISPGDAADEVLAAEQHLLAFVLPGNAPREIVRSIMERLTSYRFQRVEHRVLFECVARLSGRPGSDLLANLPAELVRAGFPDFDLERFQATRRVSPEEAAELCRMLMPDQSK